MTEFGCGADADDTLLIPTIEAQDKAMISASVWPWKNNCFQAGCETSWSLYDSGAPNGSFANQNGPERPNRVRILSRIHPRGVVGRLQQYLHNTTTSSFSMTADCADKSVLLRSNETIIYVPRRLNASVVNVTGEATLKYIINNPDGSRHVIVSPTCNGQYHVLIANHTDEVEVLREQLQSGIAPSKQLADRRDVQRLRRRAYELSRFLHQTAVHIGQTFAAFVSKSVDRVSHTSTHPLRLLM